MWRVLSVNWCWAGIWWFPIMNKSLHSFSFLPFSPVATCGIAPEGFCLLHFWKPHCNLSRCFAATKIQNRSSSHGPWKIYVILWWWKAQYHFISAKVSRLCEIISPYFVRINCSVSNLMWIFRYFVVSNWKLNEWSKNTELSFHTGLWNIVAGLKTSKS